MRRRNFALEIGIVTFIAFAFFVPVVHVAFPVLQSLRCIPAHGHPCVGGALPITGSMTYWLFGVGGSMLFGAYQVNWW